jgi:hypothetical protein
MRHAIRKEAKMKISRLPQAFIQCSSGAVTFLDASFRKVLNREHLSLTLELSALIIAWSAVIAIGLAVAGFLLGEQ